MGKKHLAAGDSVEFDDNDEEGKEVTAKGQVKEYIYPHPVHPDGYVEVETEDGRTLKGNADDIKKVK